MATNKVKPSQARNALIKAIRAHLVPMMHGSPAIGKSSIVHAVAEEFNLKMIDLRLSQCDPTDLLGFPNVTSGRASYAPMDTFPIEGDALPLKAKADPNKPGSKDSYYDGWLLFLDELPTAPPAVQAAAYKLVLDRMVGNHHLHKNVAIVGAGNLESDNALVHPMSTALQSRMMHLELRLDGEEWLEWARTHNIDFRITAYHEFTKCDKLYTFDPNHTDHTYAAPRTWEFASRLLGVIDNVTGHEALVCLGGCLSEGVAAHFQAFCEFESELPKMRDIVNDPKTTKVPTEPSHLFLLAGSIGANADKNMMDKIYEYVMRLPAEFQVVTLKNIVKRDTSVMSHPAIQKWVANAGAKLF